MPRRQSRRSSHRRPALVRVCSAAHHAVTVVIVPAAALAGGPRFAEGQRCDGLGVLQGVAFVVCEGEGGLEGGREEAAWGGGRVPEGVTLVVCRG